MIALIYFSGLILSFIVARYVGRTISKKNHLEYDWEYAMLNIFVSFLSWLGVLSWVILYFIETVDYKAKAPKWL